LQELVYKIDNWTIIKLLGGFATVLMLIIGFAYKIFIAKIEQATKYGYDKKIEEIKGDINRSNNIVDSITRNHLSSSQKLLDKKIEAYELLWSSILNIRDNFPPGIFLVHMLLIDSEIEKPDAFADLNNNPKIGPILRSYDRDDEMKKLIDNGKSLIILKPYLSDSSFKLFNAYQVLIGRVTHQFIWDYKHSKIYVWKNDESLEEILRITLTDKELNYIKDLKLNSLAALINLLEYKILQDYRINLEIKETTTDTIEYLKDISKIINNKA